jgi:hypothetical protein
MRPTPTQQMALSMARELERNRLTVVLAPAQRDGSVRSVVSENPEWYQKLCAAHTSNRRDRLKWRKHKTSIKRAMVVRALLAIGLGRKQRARHFGPPTYQKWLRPIIRAEIRAQQRERAEIRAARKAPF